MAGTPPPVFAQPQGPPGMMPPQEKTGGLAIASLVLSLIGICCLVPAIVGIILGLIELDNIKKGQSSEKGKSMATAGIIIGVVAIMLNIIATIILVLTGGFSFEVTT